MNFNLRTNIFSKIKLHVFKKSQTFCSKSVKSTQIKNLKCKRISSIWSTNHLEYEENLPKLKDEWSSSFEEGGNKKWSLTKQKRWRGEERENWTKDILWESGGGWNVFNKYLRGDSNFLHFTNKNKIKIKSGISFLN